MRLYIYNYNITYSNGSIEQPNPCFQQCPNNSQKCDPKTISFPYNQAYLWEVYGNGCATFRSRWKFPFGRSWLFVYVIHILLLYMHMIIWLYIYICMFYVYISYYHVVNISGIMTCTTIITRSISNNQHPLDSCCSLHQKGRQSILHWCWWCHLAKLVGTNHDGSASVPQHHKLILFGESPVFFVFTS